MQTRKNFSKRAKRQLKRTRKNQAGGGASSLPQHLQLVANHMATQKKRGLFESNTNYRNRLLSSYTKNFITPSMKELANANQSTRVILMRSERSAQRALGNNLQFKAATHAIQTHGYKPPKKPKTLMELRRR